jgi:hypothetical protein
MGIELTEGKRRIDDPRDHVRLELELALTRNIPVIPVLVRKANIPAENALPPSLRSLAYRNGIQVLPILIFMPMSTGLSKASSLI